MLGGPSDYTATRRLPGMLAHHLGLDISVEQRRRFVSLMSVAADDAGLPDDPEFRAAIIGYLEWGTRLAMQNSKPGAEVIPEAPVPHWGWAWRRPTSVRTTRSVESRGDQVGADRGGRRRQRFPIEVRYRLRRHGGRVGGDVDRGDHPTSRIADRGGQGAQALLQLLVDERPALLRGP